MMLQEMKAIFRNRPRFLSNRVKISNHNKLIWVAIIFPNPFTPRDENTRIRYQLSNPSEVTIEIYDIGNKLVRRLANNITKLAGAHSEDVWDGRNESGSSVANGAYLCKIQTQEFTNFIRIAVVN